MNQPPKILRIKRKRGQDPLQALILEDRRDAKRSKPSTPATSQLPSPVHTPRPPSPLDLAKVAQSFYTLSRTDDLDKTGEDQSVIESVLRLVGDETEGTDNAEADSNTTAAAGKTKQASAKSRKRKFIIPSHQTIEDAVIPNELSDMVNSYLNVNEEGGSRRKRRAKHSDTPEIPNPPPSEDTSTTSDYVYDVYLLSNTEPLTSANHPQAQIGYIRFFDDDDSLYQSDEDDDNKPAVLSDDEDSNAEDFYQNDYPSDEDAGAFSETNDLDSEEEEEEEDGRIGGIEQLGEDDYEDYGDISYLPDDNHYNDEDDYDEDEEPSSFTRNKFFASDDTDPLAIHRDKIFSKLQKMINEQ